MIRSLATLVVGVVLEAGRGRGPRQGVHVLDVPGAGPAPRRQLAHGEADVPHGGSRETRTIDLPAGTYRVRVQPKYGYLGSTSAEVTLVR
jgi:hypothetical protein